jgi:hypothetical protein
MDDLERWLRSAMRDVHQQPPPNLLGRVWRRRRNHLRRMGACSAAAVVAVAIAVPAVLYSAQHGSGHATGPVIGYVTPAGAAPGSELLKCPAYSDRGITGGELGARWKSASIAAGPVWFVYAGNGSWRSSQRLPDGRYRDVAGVVVAVRNGTTVEITTPSADRSRFRFLVSETSSGTYTLADGVPGLTLVSCPSQPVPQGLPAGYAAGLTLFYLPVGYVTDLVGCLPLEIATPPSWHVRWTAELPAHGSCRPAGS